MTSAGLVQFWLKNDFNKRNWSHRVKQRDNFTCQICNGFGNEAHHKIPLRDIIEMFDVRTKKDLQKIKLLWLSIWGITLCNKCHIELEREIKYSETTNA